MSTFASTAMPIVSTMPPRPGSVIVACMKSTEAHSRKTFSTSVMHATMPASL